MNKCLTLDLKNGNSTAVYMSDDLESLRKRLMESYGSSFMVSDDNTEYIIAPVTESRLSIMHGESNKNYKSILEILDKALALSLSRDSIFIGVGGGVICDMTALASSLYMRGARLILVPTTLLSMVDASLGGKTGIDYEGYKNIIGTFYPAEEVLISSAVLETLPESEFLSGMGEVVKHALLSSDSALYDYLSDNSALIMQRDKRALSEMIRLSLLVKCQFLEKDPEEKLGIRSFLNFGHTYAHAVETITHYGISHGEAVVYGMRCALKVGEEIGVTSHEIRERSLSLIGKFPFKRVSFSGDREKEAIFEATLKDKKKKDSVVRFVLLEDMGRPVLRSLSKSEVISSIL